MASTTPNKVRYGIEKAYYAILDEEEGTYGTPKPLKGAVSMTISPEGDSSTFNADDTAYVTFSANNGYSGTLEIAALEDEAAADLLGEVKDSNGVMYEDADIQPSRFALLYEIKGNVNDQRFAFYNCQLSRPEREHNTTTDTIDPDTVSLNFTAIPKEMTIGAETKKVTKASVENSSTNSETFAGWYTEVYTPQAAA